uniref:Transmembrane protein 131 n=1 Tax=Phallusia mammillata TaxID=59560 RepID=A0A6F9DFR5_9ASCI|nr:transmembrane protein 131 [Phallusia mammillata]
MAMARSKKQQAKYESKARYCRCVVTVLQFVAFCQNVSNIAAQQGYLQSHEDSALFARQSQNLDTENLRDLPFLSAQNRIQFDPPYLDFGSQPVGIPVTRLVYIFNPSETKPLQLISISARTSHFHSSFFDEKVVLSKCNTSFEVVFLARVIGNVENTLFINTAIGTFSYQVFGVGNPNPYRLRPYLGAKVSLNSTFSPLISMHNPTGTPLQVTEIYTSSGYLHLQLPTGHHETTKKAWEIPPYETKLLMRASFLGQVADNHTAYIRIKTNNSDTAQYLILPVEVEVSSAPGIYSSLDLLDFGTLRTKDEPKTLNLFLLNSGKREVQISSIQTQPENTAVQIDFKPVKLKPSEAVYTRVANVSFHVQQVKDEAQWNGKIVIRAKEKGYAKISIPYSADVLNGTLGYNETDTFFHIPSSGVQGPIRRAVSLTNTFSFPIILHKLELPDEATKFYQIANFSSPVLIATQATVACFILECNPTAIQSLGQQITMIHQLILHTNVSTFSLPLQAFTGFLKFKVEQDNIQELNFGIMGTSDRRQMLLEVYNHNPLSISLLDCNSTIEGLTVRLLSLTRNGADVEPSVNSPFQNIVLPPNSCVTFQVEILAPQNEATLNGTLHIFTQFEVLKIAVKAKVAIGTLTFKPKKIKFNPTFPGMTVHQVITITSSFSQNAKIESITSEDKRFYYRKLKNVAGELEPNKELKVGKLYYDPRQDCKPDRCYVGLPTSTTVGHHWLTTLNLGKEAPDVDVRMYKTLRERWNSLVVNNMTSVTSTFQLNTNLIRDFNFVTHGSLYWPSLIETEDGSKNFTFPLTHVGKKSTAEITLHNPSDAPIILQILPVSLYPQPEAVLGSLELSHLLKQNEFTVENRKAFTIALPPNTSSHDSLSQMTWLDYTLNGKANRTCINMFLNPGQKQNIEVTFSPENATEVSTVILIRNNLTVLDSLLVGGVGVKEELKLGGKLSNRRESLRFKLTESLLRDCRPENRKETPTFTVRKSFTAKNFGPLPLQVLYTMVDNYPCEGYGFRVLECERYLLQPNETRDIIIAFTPDFTTSQVHRTLRIVTQQGNVLTFNLNVTLPHRMLPACQDAIPRPTWEKTLYYFVTIVMVVVFIGTLLVSYLEAMNIWEPFMRLYELDKTVQAQANGAGSEATPSDKTKPFNLEHIATNYISTGQATERPRSPRRPRSIPVRSSEKSGSWFWTLRGAYEKLLSFDLLQIMRAWRRSGTNAHDKCESGSEDDPENIFKNIKPAPVITDKLLRDLSVENVVNGFSAPKVRHRNGGRNKPRPQHGLKDRRGSKFGKSFVDDKEDQDEEPDIPWAPPENLDYEKKKPQPVDGKKSPERVSSSSSIESSRSRGSSLSSAPSECEKSKTTDKKTEVKRKRKTKLVRQQQSNENDDTSSTTTEKSSEDFEDKNSFSVDSWKQDSPHRRPNMAGKLGKGKKSDDNNASFNTSDTPSYTTANESSVRRRHTRPVSTSSVKHSNPSPPKPLLKSKSTINPPYYDTSSTDEPVCWEDPKTSFNKKDVDERMRALAESTQKVDTRMRGKGTPRKKIQSRPTQGEKQDYQVAMPTTTTSPSNDFNKENNSKSAGNPPRRSKPLLIKTKSAPVDQPPQHQPPTGGFPSPTSAAPTTQAQLDSGFSMFSAPGTQESPPTSQINTLTNVMPVWNNFGQNSFDITKGLMPQAVNPLNPVTQTSPVHWPNTAPIFNGSPTAPTPTWKGLDLLDLAAPPPGSPTTPTTSMISSGHQMWSPARNQSPVARSTHEIWSVSNAVTMDEDRNTGEGDPLGLKSIWSSESFQRRSTRDDSHFF